MKHNILRLLDEIRQSIYERARHRNEHITKVTYDELKKVLDG